MAKVTTIGAAHELPLLKRSMGLLAQLQPLVQKAKVTVTVTASALALSSATNETVGTLRPLG